MAGRRDGRRHDASAVCSGRLEALGQSIAVENRPGASGMLGLRTLAQAKPDGYTIGRSRFR